MKALVVCNDPPHGTERSYNGLRLASALARRDGTDVMAPTCGCSGSETLSAAPCPARRCPRATTTWNA